MEPIIDCDGDSPVTSRPPICHLDTETSKLLRRSQIIHKVSDVVRELVDNAVDSGASKVQVFMDNFGLDRIRVRDDGYGISPDDIQLVVCGGYTSKLHDTSHLSCANEYGFRGEGLASICSLASVSISTKREIDKYAFTYTLDPQGKVTGKTPIAFGRGTEVSVKELFAKFPVRRNFFRGKSRMTRELKESESYLKSIALANPKVYFSLVHNGNVIWSKPVVNTVEDALNIIFGRDAAKQLTKCGPISFSSEQETDAAIPLTTTLEIYVPSRLQTDSRSTIFTSARNSFILLNRRRVYVKEIDKVIDNYICLDQLNQSSATKLKYPLVVVKIESPPHLIDFNREMDKSKVFIENKEQILDELEEMIKNFYEKNIQPPSISNNSTARVYENVADENCNPNSSIHAKQIPTGEIYRTSNNISTFLSELPSTDKGNFTKSPGKMGFDGSRPSCTVASPNISELLQTSIDNSSRLSDPVIAEAIRDSEWIFKGTSCRDNSTESTSLVQDVVAKQTDEIILRSKPGLSLESSTAIARSDDEFFERLQTCHLRLQHNTSSSEDSNIVMKKRRLSETLRPFYEDETQSTSAKQSKWSSPNSVLPSNTLPPLRCKQLRQGKLDFGSQLRQRSQSPIDPPPKCDFRPASSMINLSNLGGRIGITKGKEKDLEVDDLMTPSSIAPNPQSSLAVMETVFPEGQRTPRKPEKESTPRTVSRGKKKVIASNSNSQIPISSRHISFNIWESRRKLKESTFNSENSEPSLRVISQLGNTPMFIVKVGSLLGVLHTKNLLDLVPTLHEGLEFTDSDKKLTMTSVEKLLEGFTTLSTDDYCEEMVNSMFQLLTDLSDE